MMANFMFTFTTFFHKCYSFTWGLEKSLFIIHFLEDYYPQPETFIHSG